MNVEQIHSLARYSGRSERNWRLPTKRAGVKVISRTRCSQRRRTGFAKSPSPYPLPEYRERERNEPFG